MYWVNKWITINKESYFFKSYPSENQRTDLVEILCSQILKKVGCKHFVEYKPYTNLKDKGVVCKNFKTENTLYTKNFWDILFANFLAKNPQYKNKPSIKSQHIIMERIEEESKGQYFNSVEKVLDEIQKYCEREHIKINLKETERRLNEVIIADYFFCQPDRNLSNIEFLFNKTNNENEIICEPAPIFDNGFAFAIIESRKVYEDADYIMGISENGRCNKSFKKNRFFNNNKIILNDIIDATKNDKYLKTLFINFCKINMMDELKEFDRNYETITPVMKHKILAQDQNIRTRIKEYFALRDKILEKNAKFNAKHQQHKNLQQQL